jgi:predicted  nucleic acid-binding Zn-ribbon protein
MLDGQMESLHMAADANGAAAVKQVDGLKSAMANLSGPKQEKVKAAMDHYIAAEPKLRATMLRVESGRKNIIAKTDEMRAAVAHQKGQEAKQDEKKAEKDLGDLQEKKKQTTEMISTFIDFAKILANPEEGFSKALSKGESMVGSTITDMALGNTYVEQIAAAQQRLSALQSKVESLEDEEVMARVSGAVAELDKARTDLEATLTDLQGATNDAAIAESDLEKELGGLGKAGKAADDAIDEGDAMVQTGNDAAALSHDLRERVDGMDERIHRIERGIDRYEEMMDHADLSSDDATDDHQSVVQDRRASTAWSDYIKRQEKDLNEADAFIAKGSYRKPYQEGIDSALTKVRQGL